MNISLTLSPSIAAWAKAQASAETAILDVLEAHLATIDSPTIRAGKLLKTNALSMPENMEFEIPQVIGRLDWEALSRSERLSLGKEIKRTPEAFGLVFLRKSASNHAIYKRAL
ncbi:single-stranded DNA-binding protein [Pseudomonas sp. BF-R-01]|uniref:single-stranded DNA-binding protein n=1 Tax=Pseudomonas sp. BF-R-01 TaxID=2832365 RepID=UPI001CBD1C9B|nr:single-stranded DNA-binding protein [Pseudomonas sp. BF-R-01]